MADITEKLCIRSYMKLGKLVTEIYEVHKSVRFEVSTAVTMMIIISQKMIIMHKSAFRGKLLAVL
jgi:hypothetical protein